MNIGQCVGQKKPAEIQWLQYCFQLFSIRTVAAVFIAYTMTISVLENLCIILTKAVKCKYKNRTLIRNYSGIKITLIGLFPTALDMLAPHLKKSYTRTGRHRKQIRRAIAPLPVDNTSSKRYPGVSTVQMKSNLQA